MATGKNLAAFDLFRHALEINPNAPEVHYELAGFYFMLKQPEKALACYEKAVALDPTNNNYLEYLGQMLINRKDYARAITVYERLYKGNKSRTDILQLLYQLYGEEGQYDQMLDVIDRMEQSLWSVEIFFQVFYFKDRICHYCSLLSMENPGSS